MSTRGVDRLLGGGHQLRAEAWARGAQVRAIRRQTPRMASHAPAPPQLMETAVTASTVSGAAAPAMSVDPMVMAATPPATALEPATIAAAFARDIDTVIRVRPLRRTTETVVASI